MIITPLTGQCLVEILPNSDTIGGIVIPDGVQQKDSRGKLSLVRGIVRRLGRWPQKKGGRCSLPEFVPGDLVICSQYSGTKMKRLGDRFRLIRVENVLAKIVEEKD